MTNVEQAKITMFVALDKVLDEESDAFAGNADYEAEVALFKEALTDHHAKAVAAHADNSGFSAEKLKQKIVLSEMGSVLSGKAYVKFINLERNDLAAQLHIMPTDYKEAADSQCLKLASEAHKLMSAHIDLLSLTNTITATMLVDFKKEIEKFELLQGTSETVHKVSTQQTKEFKDSFKPLMLRVEHLKLLTREYKISKPGFYDKVMASAEIPTINIRHTYVTVSVEGKNTGHAVEGVILTLSNTTKTSVTDSEGNGRIDKMKRGQAVLRGELDGKVVFDKHIVIKNGKLNHFDFVIEER